MKGIKKQRNTEWIKSEANTFWAEIAPCNHLLQIYESDDVLLGALEGFTLSGISNGESVIIIATEAHIKALSQRLAAKGMNPEELKKEGRYLALEANALLAEFMHDDWPDESLFTKSIKSILKKARGTQNRKVRAYGEMVAVLWAEGNSGATVQLEHLWNGFCEQEVFSLFCAYPKSGFTQDAHESLEQICCAHSKLLAGDKVSASEVFYKRS